IPRISGVRDFESCGCDSSDDRMWHEQFGVVIGPHPKLGPNQRAMVAKDYGMVDGSTVLRVRYAMLFYTLKRLGLLDRPEEKAPRTQHIVVINREETDEALRRADWSL